MLFLQGTNDEFAERGLIEATVAKLGKRATLRLFEHADHSFHAPAKSGRKDAEVLGELLDALTGGSSVGQNSESVFRLLLATASFPK